MKITYVLLQARKRPVELLYVDDIRDESLLLAQHPVHSNRRVQGDLEVGCGSTGLPQYLAELSYGTKGRAQLFVPGLCRYGNTCRCDIAVLAFGFRGFGTRGCGRKE